MEKETALVKKDDLTLCEIPREEIKDMVAQFGTLKIVPGDKKSYDKIKSAKNRFVKIRTGIEKNRLALNKADRDTIAEGIKKRDDLAKELTAIFSTAEDHLTAEVKKEDDRIAEIEAKRVFDIKQRMTAISNHSTVEYTETSESLQQRIKMVENMIIDELYEEFQLEAQGLKDTILNTLNTALEARIKFEKEESERQAEKERLEKIAKEQAEAQKKIDEEIARKAKELAEQQVKIDAEYKRIADEQKKIQDEKDRIAREKQAEIDRKEKEEFQRKAQEEARIKAEADAKAKAEKEEADRIAKQKAEDEKERKRLARLPDKEKLLFFIDATWKHIDEYPENKIKDPVAKDLFVSCLFSINTAITTLKKAVEAL